MSTGDVVDVGVGLELISLRRDAAAAAASAADDAAKNDDGDGDVVDAVGDGGTTVAMLSTG